MALKTRLDTLDGLDEATAKLYKKSGDKFVLDVEGVDDNDATGLKAKTDELLGENRKLKQKLKEREDAEAIAAEEARKAREEAAKKSGDVGALEKSWQEKLAAREAELQKKYDTDVGSLTADLDRLLIDNVAAGMARELAIQGSDGLLMPHIKSRLKVDVRDGQRTTVVVDAKGQPSALTLDDLKKEFTGNPAFAPVIAGSKASGGGAGGAKSGGAAGAKTMKRSEFDALSPPEKAARMSEGVTLTDQ